MKKPLMCDPRWLEQDLSGRNYIVTGSTSGIGWITARQLAARNARVTLAVRNVRAGQAAAERIRAEHPAAQLEVQELDLTSLGSVERFAERYLETHTSLHGLVNNAGVMNTPLARTSEGFELQFGTNHLGHFRLTQLLLERIRATAGARVVNVSSAYHDAAMGRPGKIHFDDLNYERRKYDGWEAYAQSKLANVLHARALSRRLADTTAIAVSVHPGWVRTRLITHTMPLFFQDFPLFRAVFRALGMIEPWEGAQATLHALLAPDVAQHSGAFFSQLGHYRDKSCNGGGFPMVSPNPEANDDAIAERLWQESERLVSRAASKVKDAA